MKVAVYYNNKDIRIEERPKPSIHDGEILLKVRASGICGTDIMEWYRIAKAPRVFGHEIAGDIVESKSKKFSVGQRVFVSHHVPCNQCKYCLSGNHTACEELHKGNYEPGGYSEFVRVPVENVERGTYILPDDVSYEEGTMIEPLACAVRGLRIIGVQKGQTVLILGSGVSGLLNIALAKQIGAQVIATDINEYRMKKAREYGADEVVDVRKELPCRAERVVVCTCAPVAIKQAFDCIDRKGIILLFAVPKEFFNVPSAIFWRNELTLLSSYGAAPADLEEALSLIANNKINVNDMITHTFALDKIQDGFNLMIEAGESLKVVLKP